MNTRTYHHITKAERQEIALYSEKGYSRRDIARLLERSPNSISQEIKENSVNGAYDPRKAQHKAYVKRKYSKYQGMKIVERPDLRSYVEENLKEDWSPEEISGRIRYEDTCLPYVSAKGIYKFIESPYGGSLSLWLRYRGTKRKPREAKGATRIENRIFIDHRPKYVEKRRRFGDWEGDFIVSGKGGSGALLVLHERKSRYVIVKKLVSRSPEVVNAVIHEMIGGLVCFGSLTLDNDISFQKHQELSFLLGCTVYFCHPYHSWEKGGVENTNKLIRQYIPKRSDISQYSDEYILMVQDKLNARPRKCLMFKTPEEVMRKHRQFKETISDILKVIDKHKTPAAEVSYLRGLGAGGTWASL